MSKQSYRYPRDEFDDVPEDAPTGVHRVPRSAWHKVVPFVVVAVVFAVVAYVGVTVWSSGLGGGSASADDDPASVSTSASTKAATKSPKATTGTKGSGSTTDSDDDSAAGDDSAHSDADGDDSADSTVDTSLSISVKNGTTITGLAASAAAKLKAQGFTTVAASQYAGGALPGSVVYYVADGDAATAKKVASTLGIDDVEQVTSLKGGAPIIAVLMHALS